MSEVASTRDGLPATTFIFECDIRQYISQHDEQRDALDTEHEEHEPEVVDESAERAG